MGATSRGWEQTLPATTGTVSSTPTIPEVLQAIAASREALRTKIDTLSIDLGLLRDDHRRLSEREARRAWCCGSGGEAALPRPARREHGGRVAPFGFPVGSPGGSRAVGPGLRWALGAGLLAGAWPGGRRGFRFGRAPSEQQETRGARGSERAPPDMA
ncbi:hypothetical protein NDU88_006249 [Pleurodeles waltl]|uniref:Uncharacterized protein n=1 Tax=Pleurodeles waltl TaxID=8319 RepID=A0AAV7N0Q9_PLEWA|nr:hypothetical protein NDU88_006249 [Pleurodeles waltl]